MDWERRQQREAQKPKRRGTPARRREGPKLGCNDPCWCGSGKKYKHCHLRQDQGG
jgi:preprotein translocase subunit SecA